MNTGPVPGFVVVKRVEKRSDGALFVSRVVELEEMP